MENINEPSPNVSISTGKSDEVNNDSIVYPSTLKIFHESKRNIRASVMVKNFPFENYIICKCIKFFQSELF